VSPRLHLFEFEDLEWFPQVVRMGMMDFLRHLITWLNFYGPVAPVIKDTLERSGEQKLLELCAGGGGGVMKLRENLQHLDCQPRNHLKRSYPNISSYEELKSASHGQVDFISYSVNALDVPPVQKGMRLLFSSFHHFKPEQAKEILRDAVRKNVAIGVFDSGNKACSLYLPSLYFSQSFSFSLRHFFKPFRWSRLFFTYVLPLIPVCTVWDGCVSMMRLYTLKDMNTLTNEIAAKNYIWKTGQVMNSMGATVNYLVGYPEK
jgi:hypothetical protein